MSTLRLTYYPDITQHRTPSVIHDAVVAFADALSAEMKKQGDPNAKIDVMDVVSVADQTRMIADGSCQIALIKPSSYIFAHRHNLNVLPAAVALRIIDNKVGDTYFAQLYAHADTGIQSMDALLRRCRVSDSTKRPSIAFGDAFSTSNFLVPASLLLKNGIHPLTRFSKVLFAGGHDLAAIAVYKRNADIGAGHDGVIVDLARQSGYPDALQKLIRIGRVDIHSDPVAVNVDDKRRSLITQSLLNIAQLPPIKQALDIFWGAVKGLGPTRHENYASIEDAITALNIPESDILGI